MSDLYPTLSLGEKTPVPNDLDVNFNVAPLQSFSQWSSSSGSNINDPLLSAQGYADYQRGHFFRTGELDDEVESSITQGLVGSLLNNQLVTPEQVESEDFLDTLNPQADAQTQANLVRMAYGERAGSTYLSNIQSESGNQEELDKQLNSAKTLLVDSGVLPFARVKDDKGVDKIIGGAGITDRGKSLDDAVRLGALNYSDAYRVMSGLKKGMSDASVFENIREAQLLTELNAVLGSDEDAEIPQNALDVMRGLIKSKDEDATLDQEQDILAVVGDIRKGLSSAYARKNGFGEGAALERYSDKEIRDAVELLAANEVNEKGEFKFYDEDDSKNIRVLGSGHVMAHPNLMQQRERFEKAIKNDDRLSEDQITSLRNQRKLYRQLTYEQYDKFLADTAATSDNWIAAKQAGRASGASDVDILDTFLADKRNYSSIKNRLGDIAATIPDAVVGLFASLGAVVFRSEGATKYLVDNQMDRQRRREVAAIFGDEFGWGMDLSNVVAPMVVDVSATALLSAGTLGAGGVLYAGTKAGAKQTAKALVKNLTKAATGRQFGDTAKDIALKAAARKEGKDSAKTVTDKGVQEAIKAYNKAIANKTFRKAAPFPPLFLTAANRSAGNTYATVYAAQPDSLTHEEKHDAALGYALMGGTVTGLITSAFMGVGLGGFEQAFLRGMTYKGMSAGMSKILNLDIRGLTSTKVKEAIKVSVEKQLKEAAKKSRFIKELGVPAASEAAEEGLDEFIQTFIMDAALNENTPMIDRLMVGLHAASLGGVMGGGVVGVQRMFDKGTGVRYERFQQQTIDKIISDLEGSSPLTQQFLRDNREQITRQLRTASRSRDPITTTVSDSDVDMITDRYNEYLSGRITQKEFEESTNSTLKEAEIFVDGVEVSQAKELLSQEITEKLKQQRITKEDSDFIIQEGQQRETQVGELSQETEEKLERQLEEGRQRAIEQEEQLVKTFDTVWGTREKSIELGEGLSADEHYQRYLDARADAEQVADFWGMESRVDYNESNKGLGAYRAEQTEEGMRLVINPWGLARLTMGLNKANAQHVARFEAAHEVIHHAAWRNLAKAEIDVIFSALSENEVNDIIDTYYNTDEKRQAARSQLSPDSLKVQRRNMQHIIVDEYLRMKAQRITKGYTTEEEINFYKSNPNFVRVLLRYLRSYVNRFNALRELNADNPVISAAMHRLTGEMTRLKGGYQINTAVKFDIDDPENSVNKLITYLDDKPFIDRDPNRKIDMGVRQTQAGSLDEKYLKLAANPEANQQELQKMVDDAAKKAGYNIGPLLHGTPSEFNAFSYNKIGFGTGFQYGTGFYFTTSPTQARAYARDNGKVLSAYLKVDNPRAFNSAPLSSEELIPVIERAAELELQDNLREDSQAVIDDTFISNFGGIEAAAEMLANEDTIAEQLGAMKGSGVAPEYYHKALKQITGIDALTGVDKEPSSVEFTIKEGKSGRKSVKNVEVEGTNVTVVLTPEQIKLSDPVTKDDRGNIIPISERFYRTSQDIRYTQAGSLEGFYENIEEVPPITSQVNEKEVDSLVNVKTASDLNDPAEQEIFEKAVDNINKDRSGILAVAANRLFSKDESKKINQATYNEIRNRVFPYKNVDQVPKAPNAEDIKNVWPKKKDGTPSSKVIAGGSTKFGAISYNDAFKELQNQKVSVRLDIPTFNKSIREKDAPVYAVTIMGPNMQGALAYTGYAKIKLDGIESKVGHAAKIATGTNKFVMASTEGELMEFKPKDLNAFRKDWASGKVGPKKTGEDRWVEVAVNPLRSSEFVDVTNPLDPVPVINGSTAIHVGNRVFVQQPVWGKRPDYGVEGDVRFTQAGGLESGTFETTEGGLGYGGYAPLFDLPFFETGKYRKKKDGLFGSLVNKFRGELDPRVKRLIEQRRQIQDAVETDVVNFKNQLDKIIKEDFDGKAPVALIQALVGSRENISPETEQAYLDLIKGVKSESKIAEIRAEYVEGRRKEFRDRKNKAISELAKIQKVPEKDSDKTRLVRHLLGGKIDGKKVLGLRALTDELSTVIRGIVGEDSEMGIAIDDNLELYLHREYKLFSDKEYRDNIRTDSRYDTVRKNAGDFLYKQYKTFNKDWRNEVKKFPTVAEFKAKLVNDYLDLHIKSDRSASNLFNNLKDHKKSIVSLNIGALKRRKNPPQELRELLGQVADETGYNELLETFSHLGLVASQINFISNLKKFGMDTKKTGGQPFIIEAELDEVQVEGKEATYKPAPEGYSILKVAAGADTSIINTAPFADGKTYYVLTEMEQAVSAILDPAAKVNQSEADKANQFVSEVGAKLTGLSLGAKTLGSIGFYVRNILSNIVFFGPSQGFWRFGKMGQSLRKEFIRKKYLSMEPEEVSAFHRTMIGLGVIGNEIEAGLLQDFLTNPRSEAQLQKELLDNLDGLESETSGDKKALDISVISEKVGKSRAGRFARRLRELSQTVDSFYKIAYFMNELEVLQQARAKHGTSTAENQINYGALSDEELMQMAADKVKKTAQSYDQAPPFVQKLRDSWFGVMFAPFIRFKLEVPRIMLNTVILARKEMADTNPVIRKRGKDRMIGFTSVLVGFSAITPVIVNALAGIGDEEEEALRDSMPEYLRSNSFFFFNTGGKLYSADLTYLNPYAMMVDPFLRSFDELMRGSPSEAGAAFFKAMIADQYLDQQILAGAVTSALNNRDPENGRPITEVNDTAWEAFSKKFQFIFSEAYAPRTLEKVYRDGFVKLMEGDPDVSDFIMTPLGALAKEFLPLRPYEIVPEQQLDRFLSERAGEYRRAAALKNRMYTDDSISEDAVKGMADTEIERRRRINEHLIKAFRGFKKLGLTDEQIYAQALERGYGKRRVALLLNGLMERPVLQTPFIRNMAVKGDTHIQRLRTFNDQLETYGRYIPVE